jgi:anti-repressor protein
MKLIKSENFGAIICDIYDDNGSRYMTREQIGRALEYSEPIIAISKIHNRYKARLDQFSVVTKLVSTDGKSYLTTVYTRKGVMEICRHSDQPNADAFMDWTWEVMDAVIEQKQSATPNELIAALANANVITDRRLAEHEKSSRRFPTAWTTSSSISPRRWTIGEAKPAGL